MLGERYLTFMSELFRVNIKPSIFETEQVLIVDSEFIQYGAANFSKFEIAAIRYGVAPIEGYKFRIGRIYSIDVRSLDGKILKIRLKSLYRIGRKRLGKKYKEIVEVIFVNYFSDICKEYLRLFKEGKEFEILGNKFTSSGLFLVRSNQFVPWTDLGSKTYYTYYSLFSKENPNLYRTFTYLLDWNTAVLYTVSTAIIKSKNN